MAGVHCSMPEAKFENETPERACGTVVCCAAVCALWACLLCGCCKKELDESIEHHTLLLPPK